MMAPHEARKVLGVEPAASKADIQNAYRDLAKVWHPDRFASENERLRTKAEERFKEIQAAYDVLMQSQPDAESREAHTQMQGPDGKWVSQQSRISMLRFWVVLIVLSLIALRLGLIFRSVPVSVIVIAAIIWFTLRLSRVKV